MQWGKAEPSLRAGALPFSLQKMEPFWVLSKVAQPVKVKDNVATALIPKVEISTNKHT
ncbi:MAG: hypothetical protein ACOX4U_05140 [Anaerovoracaceae bacterium]